MRIFFLSFFILFFLKTNAQQLKVDVSAPSAILINANTGKVLFEKEPNIRLFPASTTKIATLSYILEKKAPQMDEMLVASSESLGIVHASVRQSPNTKHPSYRLEYGGTHMFIKPGETLSLDTLLHGLMLSSANDGANVLAEHFSSNVPQFLEELNQYLRSLGLHETHFNNPHGLYHEDHYTTAADLARLTQHALKNPYFRDIVKTQKYVRHKTNKQDEKILIQNNRLLKEGKFYYPKAIGVKTGYIARAGYCFVAAAEHEGRTLIAVLLKCPSSESRFQDAIKLFEAAFSEIPVKRILFAQGHDQFSTNVDGVKEPIRAILAKDVAVEYFPSEEPVCFPKINWKKLSLPIQKGDVVGEIQITSGNNILSTTPIYANNSIDKTFFMRISEIIHTPHIKGLLLLFIIATVLHVFVRKKSKSTSR